MEREAMLGRSLDSDDWQDIESTYGLGYVAGRLRGGGSAPTECQHLASSAFDPLRKAPGFKFDAIDKNKAFAACASEFERNSSDPAAAYLFGRTAEIRGECNEKSLKAYLTSAQKDYPAAWNNLAHCAELADLRENHRLKFGMAQRVYTLTFATLFPRLMAAAKDQRAREAVMWFAERAAEFGSTRAYLALSQLKTSNADRLFHILAAGRFADSKDRGPTLTKLVNEGRSELKQAEPNLRAVVYARLNSLPNKKDLLEPLPDDIVAHILEGLRKKPKG
jgi:hypothetical protein